MTALEQKRGRGELIALTLTGSWRSTVESPPLASTELAEITPLLIQSGAGALAWWRVRNSPLANSEAGADLHESYRMHRLEASLHLQRIKRFVTAFRRAGIEPVLVKGWNVARRYAEPGLRSYLDVDFCVAGDRYTEAVGLRERIDEGSYIDLHNELDHLDVMPWAEFFARTELVRIDELDVRVPCPEDHLRILCIHWLRHGAWKPAGLCDIAVEFETLPSDFDWQRCLGSDPVRAEWVACTIGLAQELLGAEARAKCEEQSAKRFAGSAERELPRWLVPAVLRQWSRSLSPTYREPALPAVLARLTRWKELTMDLYSRLDHPVRATVALRGRFNNWPRLPYQLGELILHSSEAPKQLGMMLSARRTNEQPVSAQGQ